MSENGEYFEFLDPLRSQSLILREYDFFGSNSQYLFKRYGDIELSFGVRLNPTKRVSVRFVLYEDQMNNATAHFDGLQKRVAGIPPYVRWEINEVDNRTTIVLFREGDYMPHPDECREWMFNSWKAFEAHRSSIKM